MFRGEQFKINTDRETEGISVVSAIIDFEVLTLSGSKRKRKEEENRSMVDRYCCPIILAMKKIEERLPIQCGVILLFSVAECHFHFF